MTEYELLSTVLAVLGVLVIPLTVFIIRGAVKWASVEHVLGDLGNDLKEMKADIKSDREATNKRLVWLEQTLWRRFGSDSERTR